MRHVENVFENELSHCLVGDLDCSELGGRRILSGIAVKCRINISVKYEVLLWSLGFSDIFSQAVVNMTCRILNLD